MTWYEKCYGEPPPVKKVEEKKPLNKLPQLLKDEENKVIKESAWYRAKHDYLKHLIEKDNA